ncbi:MAG: AGE family epimerase/isomerase [Chitinophagaceae bacterium]|nr:AGE family epimerase/isomerase [Chitinophagaceae bacterium]
MNPQALSKTYQNELLNNVIPFWLKHSADNTYGGYFTCLDRTGKVFDTDKFVWLQCRQVWTFSMLYNEVEKKQEWLDFALSGARFLIKHGRDKEGNWYFSLTREGQPLIQPYNIFSDCFAAMAFGQLAKATGDESYAAIAHETFSNILKRQDAPKGKYSKAYPGTRYLQSFALPMILSNLVLEIEHILEPKLVNEVIDQGIDTVMNKFYRPDLRVILEHINADGTTSDSFEGRLVNPGHGLEAMWFIMDLAKKTKDEGLMNKAVEVALNLMGYGWDTQYGGIFYFMDVKNCPPLQLEWDQKLWWVHIEAMIAMLKGYQHTGNENCLQWFEKLHDYTWNHFTDSEYGEWFGYLNRRGEVLISLKGGKWKGCFHVPRGLYQIGKILEQLS